jgi:hypothetical protein
MNHVISQLYVDLEDATCRLRSHRSYLHSTAVGLPPSLQPKLIYTRFIDPGGMKDWVGVRAVAHAELFAQGSNAKTWHDPAWHWMETISWDYKLGVVTISVSHSAVIVDT